MAGISAVLYDRGMLNPVDISVLTFEQRGDLIVRLLEQIALLGREMHVALAILLVAVSVAMWLKLIEVVLHMIRFYPSSPIVGSTSSADITREWPVTAVIARVAVFLPRRCRPYLFRFKILVFLLILLSFLATRGAVALFAGVTLYSALWIQLIRILIDQAKYGSAVYLRGPVLPNPLFAATFGGPSARQKLRAFLHLFLGLCAVVAVGFAALFYLCHIQTGGTAFKGLPDDGWTFFHLIYFSIVTLATVGYGDVTPTESVMPRFLVASEIVAGFLILVALVTSVSLTFQVGTDDNAA